MDPIRQTAQDVLLSVNQNLIQKNDQGPTHCTTCQGTGWVPTVDKAGNNCVRECECAKQRRLHARIATILQDWPEYAQASIDDFKPRSVGQNNAAIALQENISGSYYFTGLYRRGKTFFLVAQYRAMALAGNKCLLRSARDLAEELRASEVNTNGTEPVPSAVMYLVNHETAAHLFIDDIEKVAASAFRSEMLWDILDTVKRRQLRLSVSSNLPMYLKDEVKYRDKNKPLPDLRDKLGDAIVSRLYQICKVVEL